MEYHGWLDFLRVIAFGKIIAAWVIQALSFIKEHLVHDFHLQKNNF